MKNSKIMIIVICMVVAIAIVVAFSVKEKPNEQTTVPIEIVEEKEESTNNETINEGELSVGTLPEDSEELKESNDEEVTQETIPATTQETVPETTVEATEEEKDNEKSYGAGGGIGIATPSGQELPPPKNISAGELQ